MNTAKDTSIGATVESPPESIPGRINRPRDTSLDAVKGVLISLVCLGHVHLFSERFPNAVNFLYLFHIPLFLAVSCFMVSVRAPSDLAPFARRRFAKLILPCFSWVVIYSLLAAVSGRRTFVSFGDWIADLSLALGMANISAMREATSSALLWFLPCLFTTNMLFAVFRSTGFRNSVCFLFACVVYLMAYPILGSNSHVYVPWGIDVAVYLMPLCFAATIVYTSGRLNRLPIVGICVFVTLILGYALDRASITRGLQSMILPSRLWQGVLCDVFCLSLFVSIYGLCALLARRRVLGALTSLLGLSGRHSFGIYVTHPILLAITAPWFPIRGRYSPEGVEVVVSVIGQLMIAVGGGVLISWILSRRPFLSYFLLGATARSSTLAQGTGDSSKSRFVLSNRGVESADSRVEEA